MFRTCSDCGGDVESRFTKDQLLTNIMFYWAPNSIASAARIYYEGRAENMGGRIPNPERIAVPTGVASFPKEIWMTPRSWVERAYNLIHWIEMPTGGHFASLEEPEMFVADVRSFFRLVR